MQAGYQYDVNIVKGDSKEFSWQAMLDYFKESWKVFFWHPCSLYWSNILSSPRAY